MQTVTDLQRLEQLTRLCADLFAETDSDALPPAIISAALEVTRADAGVLYLLPTDGLLCCEAVQIASLGLATSGEELGDILPMIPVSRGTRDGLTLLQRTFLENRSFLVEAGAAPADRPSEQQVFDEAFNYQSGALLSLPLRGCEGRILGVMQLVNPPSGRFSRPARLLAEHLAGSAGSVLHRNRQLEEQKALFEATIQMIAGAVDEKFYLGTDHCRRVPVLTMMLARAVNRTSNPPFSGQHFDEKDLYELEVASWLHDCGKLVTPINLVEKSRKLETVFDRLDLVQTRFEIVRRDEEIARLRRGDAGEDGLTILAEGEDRSQQMLEDLHFLASCNHGMERMTPADQRRLRQIGKRYRWVDRQMEEVSVLTDDELANLSIECGTINERERVKINNHTMATLGMLDLLSFPEELRRVPEIITGCKGGPGKGVLLQSRILAIADMFVSVTAGNRSYRKSNTLDEALDILASLSREGQLDGDLLDLLVHEQIHRRYAAEFLPLDRSG